MRCQEKLGGEQCVRFKDHTEWGVPYHRTWLTMGTGLETRKVEVRWDHASRKCAQTLHRQGIGGLCLLARGHEGDCGTWIRDEWVTKPSQQLCGTVGGPHNLACELDVGHAGDHAIFWGAEGEMDPNTDGLGEAGP